MRRHKYLYFDFKSVCLKLYFSFNCKNSQMFWFRTKSKQTKHLRSHVQLILWDLVVKKNYGLDRQTQNQSRDFLIQWTHDICVEVPLCSIVLTHCLQGCLLCQSKTVWHVQLVRCLARPSTIGETHWNNYLTRNIGFIFTLVTLNRKKGDYKKLGDG